MNKLRLATAWLLIFSTTICSAQSTPHLSKHAKKIQKEISGHPIGSVLHVFLRDGTNEFGMLAAVSERGFELADQKTGAAKTISYEDVQRITTGTPSTAQQLPGTQRKIGKIGILVIIGAAAAAAVGILASQHD